VPGVKKPAIEPKYISIREAGSVLGVTDQAIYAWLKEGRIEHLKIKVEGKRTKWLISRADFDRFIEEFTVKKRPPRKAGRPSMVKMDKIA
jgi:excisionase family DNA binding protein